jgi:hypothetical protein
MKIHKSIVSGNIINHFKEPLTDDIHIHSINTCSIEKYISAANLLCPEVIEIKGYIFISEFWKGNAADIPSLEKRFNYNRKEIEMYVNSWSLVDLLFSKEDESVTGELINEFGKILLYFWELRFNVLFPEKKIKVELGEGIMGENGLTITVYQN